MRFRLWLVRLLLGRLVATHKLNASAKHIILVDSRVLRSELIASFGSFVGSCIIVPIEMQYLPEGSEIVDVVQFYELA